MLTPLMEMCGGIVVEQMLSVIMPDVFVHYLWPMFAATGIACMSCSPNCPFVLLVRACQLKMAAASEREGSVAL